MVNKLSNIIAQSGYKKGYIAKNLNLSRVSLNKKINNCQKFTVSEMNILIKILNLSEEEANSIFISK